MQQVPGSKTRGHFYCNTPKWKCATIVSRTRQLGVARLFLMALVKLIMKENERKIKVPERKKVRGFPAETLKTRTIFRNLLFGRKVPGNLVPYKKIIWNNIRNLPIWYRRYHEMRLGTLFHFFGNPKWGGRKLPFQRILRELIRIKRRKKDRIKYGILLPVMRTRSTKQKLRAFLLLRKSMRNKATQNLSSHLLAQEKRLNNMR